MDERSGSISAIEVPVVHISPLLRSLATFERNRIMIRPFEMTKPLPVELSDGSVSDTLAVWDILVASRDGDLDRLKSLAMACPGLLVCRFDYTTPLHFAVCEGHFHVVRHLVENGAFEPGYLTHPFRDSLVTMATDRGRTDIAEYLRQANDDPDMTRIGETECRIDFETDEIGQKFQDLVDRNQHAEVEALLIDRPDLALNEAAFWGEGIMMMPAKDQDRHMLELLMRFGACVPDVSKWGARYYFRHFEIARFLLETGMNPNHMNWRQFTLLHDMAFIGDVQKAGLLIDHGAEIDSIDDDYASTPLGFAARWGNRDMVRFLLEKGADPNGAGKPWAKPLVWARTKGHAAIESDLRQAGASEDSS